MFTQSIEDVPVTTCLHPLVAEAYSVLEARPLPRRLADALSALKGPDLLDLLSLAHKVRLKFAPPHHACTIMNAKSGACTEDCRFCAQSAHHDAAIDRYGLVDQAAMVSAAGQAYAGGVRSFGLVTSGRGYLDGSDEFERILDGIRAIHTAYPDLNICASLGQLSRPNVQALAQAGIAHYNINLQVAPEKYSQLIATTHTIEDKLRTIEWLHQAGIRTCVGGILGLGETMADRLDMAYALKDLDVEVIPLNVLIPIPGTPLENSSGISVAEAVKTFALFRLIHPLKTIKFAAGRETRMKDFQGLLMLAGANGFLTGGYLTTRGRKVEEDLSFREGLKGFE